jgi:tRNA modification GTPase
LPGIAARCKSLREQIQGWISQGKEGLLIRQGVKVALVGQPNVGKSSLLNALLKQDKAIVSPIPGTTRDVVEGDLSIRGIPVHLLDTAGIRESEDQIEALGVERSRRSIEEADLVVVVLDASKKNAEDEELLHATENKKRIIIYNKSDLLSEKEAGKRYVSASEGDVAELKEAIFEALGIHEDAYLAPSFSNARELGLLKEIESYLALAEQDAENEATMDLISHSLQLAYAKVKELFGEEATQDLEDEIFSRFCVGK